MQSEPSRLDRIEQLLDRLASTVATSVATSNERMTRVEENHARAEERMTRFEQKSERDHEQINAELQALSRDVSRLVDTVAAETQQRQELRDATLGIANLLASLDSDRPTILRKLNAIENKVDRLLENQS